jgi:DNA repair protein SbcC/Rad50
MVPVELRLSNFLSYGAAAPSLDFEQFHVACLSGRNGQGKSALLDAMTWALWGEARKSAGSHKPDEELVRVGARRMQVEFVFDVEGARYRVVRSYTRSASGKTSRTELEVNVYESETGEYRPLTGGSLRETQEHLQGVLGLDYDTFINSAFLLQGRSDEFTRKKPNERKEILARILNLGRFDKLADLARDKEREWSDRLQQFEADIERLQHAIQEEPRLVESREDLLARVSDRQASIGKLRQEERSVTERLALLDARQREASAGRDALVALQQRAAHYEQDGQSLRKRIKEADVLVAQRAEIERDYDLYQQLQHERDELDTKGQLYRGLEKQVEQREAELRERRLEWEKRLHAAEVDLRSNRTALQDCITALAEEPAIRRCLHDAREAQSRLEQMNKVLQQRKAVENDIAMVERQLLGMRESRAGQLEALEKQNEKDKADLPSLEVLEAERERLAVAVAERDQLAATLEQTKANGQEVAEQIKQLEGQKVAQEDALRKYLDNFDRFTSAQDGICPTCGTHLQEDRQHEVQTHFKETITSLRRHVETLGAQIAGAFEERERLRQSFRTLQHQVDQYTKVADQLSTLEERIRCYYEDQDRIGQRDLDIAELRRVLNEKDYGHPERQRWRDLQKQLEQLPFDDELFEQVRQQAAQAPHYEDRLRQLEQVAGRREQLERAVAQGEQQAQALRVQLDDGSLLGPVQEQIRRIKEQMANVGFDAARLEAVRQKLRDLANAGARMKDLVHAERSLVEWRQQLERMEERLRQVRSEMDAGTQQLQAIETELAGRSAAVAEQLRVAHQLKLEEDALHLLQVQLGEITARLERIAREREELKQRRAECADALHQRQLYKHLRTAFGRHGIPSLIIEQTLPELEDRTNELLHRITDGRMHVKLETLKDKKTGGTKETLDIIITDEHGMARAYETFSGGEAFRVNFALRIALSQLLAERSGVRIRALFIDEGFGTQDPQGIENLIDAIQTIQEDFDKILVITHLEEMKEAFPVRIEVTKDPIEGSTFEIAGV